MNDWELRKPPAEVIGRGGVTGGGKSIAKQDLYTGLKVLFIQLELVREVIKRHLGIKELHPEHSKMVSIKDRSHREPGDCIEIKVSDVYIGCVITEISDTQISVYFNPSPEYNG